MEIKHTIRFGGDTDDLAEKVLSGKKIATSSLYDYYRMHLKEMISVGEHVSILDSQDNEKCIVRIERSEIIHFKNITEAFAIDEGDGDLENWLKIHTQHYSSLLEKIGKTLTGETELLCEWFRVLR